MTTFKLDNRGLRRTAPIIGILALAFFSHPTAKTNGHPATALPQLGNLMALYGADTVTIDRNARDYKLPDQFAWKGRPEDPNQTAVLFGDSSKPGMYVQITKRKPDVWSQPHSHKNERFITVLAGTFLIGTGPKFDKKNTIAIGPGGVVHDIPNQMHYDGTGPEGATLQFIAMGPEARN